MADNLRRSLRYFALSFSVIAIFAQQPAAPPPAPPAPASDPAKPIKFEPIPPRADGKSRVFVSESRTLYANGFGFSVRNLTITVMKSINDTCPDKAVIVDNADMADYFLHIDFEGTLLVHAKLVVFKRSGEMSFVASERKIDKDVKGFCASLSGGPSSPVKKANKQH
jgi:hypothetical protein